MSIPSQATPLNGDGHAKLARPPLVRVLAQVRWPTLANAVKKSEVLATNLEEALSDTFPLKETAVESQFVVGSLPTPPTQIQSTRLLSGDGSWVVTVAPEFVTLETTNYTSSSDLVNRFRGVLDLIESSQHTPRYARLGYRYTNRVSDERDFRELPDLLSEALRRPSFGEFEAFQSVSESHFNVMDHQLSTRWAFLPPDASVDPSIQSTSKQSWLLDIDAYTLPPGDVFVAETVDAELRKLANSGYNFFKAATTDQFRNYFGESS